MSNREVALTDVSLSGSVPRVELGIYVAFVVLFFGSFALMDSQGLIWFLVIGLIAGFLAGKIMKGGGFGVVGDIVIGILGAFLGGWVFGLLGLSTYGLLGSIVTATIGAVLLLFLVRLVKRA